MTDGATSANVTGAPPAVRLRAITKRFGAVLANDRIDLDVAPGTIHGIIGENGAGKSTLVSILYGFYTADSGLTEIDGRPAAITSPADAIARGIGMVHQHFMLVPNFTVLENVMLGAEGGGLLGRGQTDTRAALDRLARDHGLEVDPDAITGDLPVGVQQRVEILKALRRGARILILDEPTGVLTPDETDRLFDILRALRDDGVTILLITHKLREIMAVCDMVSVMRRGRMVGERVPAETTREELAALMVGREVTLEARHEPSAPGEVALSAEGIFWCDASGADRLRDVSLELHSGEILGVAGVSGNGQAELLAVLSGIVAPARGQMRRGGHLIDADHPANPAELRRLGVAHVPEDRHRAGLVLPFEARENAILGYHNDPRIGPGPWASPDAMQAVTGPMMAAFDIRPPDPRLAASGFSGGNQQKLVIAREIDADPQVLLVGQPTRGVDIGAIEFIHAQLLALRDQGCAILLVSVELDEIMALSDRIMVMNAGRVVGTLDRAEATRERIGLMMAGIAGQAA